MSTKIYNGYKIPKSLDVLQDFIIDFRNKAEEIVLNDLTKLTAEMTSYNVDRFFFNSLKEPELADSALQKVMRLIDDEYSKIKKTKQRNPTYDFECEVSVLVPKESDKILLLLFTEKQNIKSLFESYEFIEEYCYWNNSDKPNDISESDWKQREIDWNKALPGSGVPARNGLSFELIGEWLPMFDASEVIKNMPSFEDRCKKVAKERVASFIKDPAVWELAKNGSIYKFIQEVSRFEQSEEGLQVYENLLKEARELLPETLTKELILSNLNEEKMLSDLKKEMKL